MEIKLSIELASGNESFQDGRHGIETARILTELAQWFTDGAEGMFDLRDINGNWVGRASFEAWEEEAQE